MFTDKVFIVTGAAGNVGSAVSHLLASRGARVAAVDTVADRLAAMVAALPNPHRHLALSAFNLMDADASKALVARTVADLGGLNGVATTVGGFAMAPVDEAGLEQWDLMFNLNVKTTWNIYRAAIPALRTGGGGALVGIGSAAGLRGSGQMAAYAATKSAVMRLTESLADELRGEHIRVNAVLPTTIDTPQNRASMPDADTSRWVKPSDIAEVMAFLLSQASSAVSGQLVQVGH